jgi:hypothetical protein
MLPRARQRKSVLCKQAMRARVDMRGRHYALPEAMGLQRCS